MDTFQGVLNAIMNAGIDPQTAGLAIAVIGLNIHFGYTGLLNFGQSGFMLLGAYGFAISTIHGLPMVLAVLIGLGCALVFALVLGIPTLKLRGDYLAIVTISAAEIIRYVGRSSLLKDFTGASTGLPGAAYRKPFNSLSPFPHPTHNTTLLPINYTKIDGGAAWIQLLSWLVALALIVVTVLAFLRLRGDGPNLGRRRAVIVGLSLVTFLSLFFAAPVTLQDTGVSGWWLIIVAWSFVVICSLLTLRLVKSPWGRLLRGIREDEDAMRSLGKNVFAMKMQALVIGGMLGALGGMFYVMGGTLQPDNLGRNLTFFAYTALLLGGAATIFGPVLGSILFFAARFGIIAATQAYVPHSVVSSQKTPALSFIVVGVALMLLVIFRPQGILGDKRELRFDV